MSKILERFREYPPLLRWVLIVAVVVIAFIVWNDIILDTAQRWKAQAAAYEREIERAAAGDRRMATQLKHTITSLGPVEPLSDEEDEESGKRELNEIINRVLSENSVANRDVNMKSAITFRNNELRRLIPPGRRGERVAVEVRFEASQEVAYKVLAELETSEAIETVSLARFAASNDPRSPKSVNVQLTVEAWVVTRDGGRSGAVAGGRL